MGLPTEDQWPGISTQKLYNLYTEPNRHSKLKEYLLEKQVEDPLAIALLEKMF